LIEERRDHEGVVRESIAFGGSVRTFRHPSRLQHRYCRAYFWRKILTDLAQKRVRELKK
jgi:hypothetical protein